MATKWFNDGSLPPQVVLDRIVSYFHRVERPVYVGTLAVEFRYQLAQVEFMLDLLTERGLIRPLTVEEKKAAYIDVRGNVYRLIEPPHPGKANW